MNQPTASNQDKHAQQSLTPTPTRAAPATRTRPDEPTITINLTPRQENDVSKRTHIPRTTAYRYIRTLHAAGLLEPDPTSRIYRLAERLRSRSSP